MNKILATCGFVLACGFGSVAMAQTADVSATTTATTATDQNEANANTGVAVGTRQVPAPGDHNCIRDTGSHIPPPKGGCLPVAGTTYSHDDLQRTGQPDVARALQQLDPSVRISGH
ncbi:MAG TPA: hypothetical protein VJ722_04665 [Rhodanobacteraceae bacterium]|nr:hypothetical protein [Rhodanobacteraceae bacterium]